MRRACRPAARLAALSVAAVVLVGCAEVPQEPRARTVVRTPAAVSGSGEAEPSDPDPSPAAPDATPGTDPSTPSASARTGDARLPALQLSIDGLDPVAAVLAEVPALTIYRDGTMISLPRTEAAYDPNMRIPALVTTDLGPAHVAELLAAAGDAGLLQHVEDDIPPDQDWAVATLALTVDGDTYVHRMSTMAPAGEPKGAPAGDDQPPRALRFVEDHLGSLPTADDGPYEPPAYAVAAAFTSIEAGRFDDTEPVEPIAEWPLETPLTAFGACRVLAGAEAAAVEEAADAANDGWWGVWSDGGLPFHVTIRPLLPHEGACPG